MFESAGESNRRAFYLSVCSGKGGTGKSTIALLTAARLAESGYRTLIIDGDTGLGDLATMANAEVLHGFESVLDGGTPLKDAVIKLRARLWLLGTSPGSDLPDAGISPLGLRECGEMDSLFDVVVIDTPSSLRPFYLKLIGGSDLALVVTTSRIPSVADSYVQLKAVIGTGSKTELSYIVNLVESEAESEQAKVKFRELVAKFLHRQMTPLAVLARIPGLQQVAEQQALLGLARQQNEVGKAFAKIVNILADKYLKAKGSGESLWRFLDSQGRLKDVATFDDRETVAVERSSGASAPLLVTK
jgi:flagellar biosynthesis protein FlhG